MYQIKRSRNVTIISWLLIIYGLITLVYTLNVLSFVFTLSVEGMPTPYFLLCMLLIIVAIYLSAGIGMLKGLNWARLLYLRAMPVVIIGSFIIQGFPTTELLVFGINIIIYLIIMVLITQPKVVAYFTQ